MQKKLYLRSRANFFAVFSLRNFLEGLYTLKTEQSYSQAIFRGYLTFKVKPSAY